MCKECEGYKMPYIANGDRLCYNSFEELTDDLKELYKGKETKQGKETYIGFINKLNENGDKLVSDYVNNSTKVCIRYSKCGHIHEGEGIAPGKYKMGRGCNICSGNVVKKGVNDLATTHPKLAKEWHPTKNGDLKPTQVSFGCNKKVWWQCEKGHEWNAEIGNRTNVNSNCPYCANKKVLKGYNDLATTHPQYIKYFVNIKDAYTHTYSSDAKVEMKCPICGTRKAMRIANLTKQGLGCPQCSDGISYPEKVFANFLTYVIKQGIIDYYIKQKRFEGYKFLYDFILYKNNKIIAIVETHGEQHYKDSSWKSYKDEHENDMIKYDIAVLNGFEYNKNYFVIDCRKSNIEWISNNIKNSKLINILNIILNDVDWEDIDRNSQNSLKWEVITTWIEQKSINKNLTPKILADYLGMKYDTVRNYLKWGNEHVKDCIYNIEEELELLKNRNTKYSVYFIDSCGNKEFDDAVSMIELERRTGINRGVLKRSMGNALGTRKGANNIKFDKKYFGYMVVDANEWDAQHN